MEQGEVCSPILFSLFINELTLVVIQNGRNSTLFTTGYFELFILLLADDVALFSETLSGLQTVELFATRCMLLSVNSNYE